DSSASAEVYVGVVVVQRDGVELPVGICSGVAEAGAVEAGAVEEVSLSVLRRFDLSLGVTVQPAAGGDELSDDEVVLATEPRIRLGLHRGLGEHSRGLLEGGGLEPGVGGQRGLGDAHQLVTTGGWAPALLEGCLIGLLEPEAVCQLAGEQGGLAGLDD